MPSCALVVALHLVVHGGDGVARRLDCPVIQIENICRVQNVPLDIPRHGAQVPHLGPLKPQHRLESIPLRPRDDFRGPIEVAILLAAEEHPLHHLGSPVPAHPRRDVSLGARDGRDGGQPVRLADPVDLVGAVAVQAGPLRLGGPPGRELHVEDALAVGQVLSDGRVAAPADEDVAVVENLHGSLVDAPEADRVEVLVEELRTLVDRVEAEVEAAGAVLSATPAVDVVAVVVEDGDLLVIAARIELRVVLPCHAQQRVAKVFALWIPQLLELVRLAAQCPENGAGPPAD